MARIWSGCFERALVVENPHASLDQLLLDKAGIVAKRIDVVADEQTLIDAINDFDAQILFKRSRVGVSRNVLEQCPGLHAIQLCCIGSDSIDLVAAADLGVAVFNDPISNGRSVVELAIGHLIALCRRLYETDVEMHDHTWMKNNRGRFEVLDKTLGIVGLGNIGRQVARAAEALGMNIRFYDNRLVAQEVGQEMGWQQDEDLAVLFESSDMVSIHTSAKDSRDRDNAGMLDDFLPLLAAQRPEPSPRIFLNLARGNLYRPQVLLAAVEAGQIRRAAVDVYPEEPSPGAPAWVNPYGNEPRITCTPHIGAATQEAQPRIARRVANTVANYSRHGAMRDCVFNPRVKMDFGEQARGRTVLAVMHSVSRGTKKAVDDAIFEANASNLGSMHRDFSTGVAYDLSVLDRPLSASELTDLERRASKLANDPTAIRSIRQVQVSE